MNHFSKIYLAMALLLMAISTTFVQLIMTSNVFLPLKLLAIVFVAMTALLSILLILLSFLHISRLHTPLTAFLQFLDNLAGLFIYKYYHTKLVNKTKNVRATQDKLLAEIVALNGQTDLGRKLNLASITCREQLKDNIPLSTFNDYRNFVERIEKGEKNVMTGERVLSISLTSGTTGHRKHIPFTESMAAIFSTEAQYPLLHDELKDEPLLSRLSPLKALRICYKPKWQLCECGLPMGMSGGCSKIPYKMALSMVTPPDEIAYMIEYAQIYVHWLFGLMDENVTKIYSNFAGDLLFNLEFLQRNWKQLADDIRHGRITNTYNIPKDVIENLQRHPMFMANPSRADVIDAECSKGFQGIVRRLWPRFTDHIVTIPTGAHAVYASRLKGFLGPQIALMPGFCICTEGLYGMAIGKTQKKDLTYTLMIHLMFFEFIPEDEMLNEEPTTVFADQVEIGKRYEVVFTQRNGLCRYRLGDVIEIVGHYNEAPVFKFCIRSGEILNLRGERTTEEMISTAVNRCTSKWQDSRGLIDFTVTDSLTFHSTLPDVVDENCEKAFGLYYVVFIEIDGLERSVNQSEVDMFQAELCSANKLYEADAACNSIQLPKIFVVRRNTFEALKRQILQMTCTASSQYKSQRYQKNPQMLRFLLDNSYT